MKTKLFLLLSVVFLLVATSCSKEDDETKYGPMPFEADEALLSSWQNGEFSGCYSATDKTVTAVTLDDDAKYDRMPSTIIIDGGHIYYPPKLVIFNGREPDTAIRDVWNALVCTGGEKSLLIGNTIEIDKKDKYTFTLKIGDDGKHPLIHAISLLDKENLSLIRDQTPATYFDDREYVLNPDLTFDKNKSVICPDMKSVYLYVIREARSKWGDKMNPASMTGQGENREIDLSEYEHLISNPEVSLY